MDAGKLSEWMFDYPESCINNILANKRSIILSFAMKRWQLLSTVILVVDMSAVVMLLGEMSAEMPTAVKVNG